MASHHIHHATSAAAGHVAVARPFSLEAFAPATPSARPVSYASVPQVQATPQVKATWRKTTAVACAALGMTQGRTMNDGTDIATRRPLGGLRG